MKRSALALLAFLALVPLLFAQNPDGKTQATYKMAYMQAKTGHPAVLYVGVPVLEYGERIYACYSIAGWADGVYDCSPPAVKGGEPTFKIRATPARAVTPALYFDPPIYKPGTSEQQPWTKGNGLLWVQGIGNWDMNDLTLENCQWVSAKRVTDGSGELLGYHVAVAPVRDGAVKLRVLKNGVQVLPTVIRDFRRTVSVKAPAAAEPQKYIGPLAGCTWRDGPAGTAYYQDAPVTVCPEAFPPSSVAPQSIPNAMPSCLSGWGVPAAAGPLAPQPGDVVRPVTARSP